MGSNVRGLQNPTGRELASAQLECRPRRALEHTLEANPTQALRQAQGRRVGPDSHARSAGCVQTMASPRPMLIAWKPRNAAKEPCGQDTAVGPKWLKKAQRKAASPLLQCPQTKSSNCSRYSWRSFSACLSGGGRTKQTTGPPRQCLQEIRPQTLPVTGGRLPKHPQTRRIPVPLSQDPTGPRLVARGKALIRQQNRTCDQDQRHAFAPAALQRRRTSWSQRWISRS